LLGDYDKNNLNRIARNRGPIMDISLHQLDQPSTPLLTHSHSRGPSLASMQDNAVVSDKTATPVRPPPPPARPSLPSLPLSGVETTVESESTIVTSPSQPPLQPQPSLCLRSKSQISAINEVQTQMQTQTREQQTQTRFISFQKDGSVGIRLTGGNLVGIFVTAVQPSSESCLQGLQAGDKILKANNTDMRGVTREEAVLFVLSIQQQTDLVVQYRNEEYDQIIAAQKGDLFHIRVHFLYTTTIKGELSFHSSEVFHVCDTLYNGIVGSWLVYRLGRNNQEIQKGTIPNIVIKMVKSCP
jgi:hypothetical protein